MGQALLLYVLLSAVLPCVESKSSISRRIYVNYGAARHRVSMGDGESLVSLMERVRKRLNVPDEKAIAFRDLQGPHVAHAPM